MQWENKPGLLLSFHTEIKQDLLQDPDCDISGAQCSLVDSEIKSLKMEDCSQTQGLNVTVKDEEEEKYVDYIKKEENGVIIKEEGNNGITKEEKNVDIIKYEKGDLINHDKILKVESFGENQQKDYDDMKSQHCPHGEKPSVCLSVLKRRTDECTGEKPYSCGDCGKHFSALGGLKVHQRIHTGVKPFSCSDCGKSFSQLGSLKTHQNIHTGVRPYSCSDCGKTFAQLSSYIIHQRIHTGEKPYSCPDCGRCFISASKLNVHQSVHADVNPFVCSRCGKGFVRSASLTRHLRLHTVRNFTHS
ncbi:hypothetical protein DPEC_G00135920 [Dallia pectoralis]|uniref:Uncharacterized protein n=1 Tax=Dallia pectoralis TaxID=75939 RepID=A0ACC2GLA3_DALPE|nr:hypothetical protein DPEC_G00135920 [Dallia pectoralis]